MKYVKIEQFGLSVLHIDPEHCRYCGSVTQSTQALLTENIVLFLSFVAE